MEGLTQDLTGHGNRDRISGAVVTFLYFINQLLAILQNVHPLVVIRLPVGVVGRGCLGIFHHAFTGLRVRGAGDIGWLHPQKLVILGLDVVLVGDAVRNRLAYHGNVCSVLMNGDIVVILINGGENIQMVRKTCRTAAQYLGGPLGNGWPGNGISRVVVPLLHFFVRRAVIQAILVQQQSIATAHQRGRQSTSRQEKGQKFGCYFISH